MDMNVGQSTVKQPSELKLTDIQSIISNKFAKAYTMRLEQEHATDQTIQSFECKSVKCIENVNVNNKQIDLNMLCNRLRILLAAQDAGRIDNTEEISSIMTKLHEHGILL